MIHNYPILQSVLIDVIPSTVYDRLERFNQCILPPSDRENLMVAFRDDVEEEELDELFKKVDQEELSTAYKKGDSLDVIFDNVVTERIYDLAQEMGPILEEIERNNNTADRINE